MTDRERIRRRNEDDEAVDDVDAGEAPSVAVDS